MVSTIDSNKEHTNRQELQIDSPEAISAVADITQHEAKDLYLDGVAAALKGKRAAAEQLLRASLALEHRNYQAWLWLAGVVGSPEESIQYLERVLELVPNEAYALEGIQWARRKLQENIAVEDSVVQEADLPTGDAVEVRDGETLPPGPAVPVAKTKRLPWIWGAMIVTGLLLVCLTMLALYIGPRFYSRIRQDIWEQQPGPVAVATTAMLPAWEPEDIPTICSMGTNIPPLTPAADAFVTPTVVVSMTPAEFRPPTQSPLSGHLLAIVTSPAVILPSPTTQTRSQVAVFRPSWYPDRSPMATLRPSDWRIPTGLWNKDREESTQGAQRQGKWIEIDISEQTLRALEDDSLVMEVKVSTGPKHAPTVQGTYRVLGKYCTIDMSGPGYYVSAVPYAMFFHDGYAIHGAYWHNKFGQPAGHGCVNMRPEEAKRLFEWIDPQLPQGVHSVRSTNTNPGTPIVIHE